VRVAMPVFRSRVSPLFDSAERVLLVDIVDGREVRRQEVVMDDTLAPHKARRLSELGVSTLLCGAISAMLYVLVRGRGIAVIPWLSGDAEEILQAFEDGSLDVRRFRMPGFNLPGRSQGRHGFAWGWGSGGEQGQGGRDR